MCRESELPVFVQLRLTDSWTTTGGELTRLTGLAEDFLSCGAAGVSFGFLDADLGIDSEVCRHLIESLPGVPWTFHRAFDDALEPVSDALVPDDGSAFAAVVPEGALRAFLGENANGVWTLRIADDGGGEQSTLQSFSLRLVVPARCGNGVTDAGEECDDGNGGNGDGCDEDCRPSACGNGLVGIDEQCDDGNTTDGDGCSSDCMLPELICDDCVDNDGNGRMDDLNRDKRIDSRDARVIMQAVERVEKAHPELVGGASAYRATKAHGPFAHIDVRGARARWGRS